jgi:hypothetical protein
VDTSAAATASVCSQCVRASSCPSSAQTTSGVSASVPLSLSRT